MAKRGAPLIIGAFGLIGLVASCQTAGPSASNAGGKDAAYVAGHYKSYRAMTKEPVHVEHRMSMLCDGGGVSNEEIRRRISGPHASAAISVYMNDPAAGAFESPGAMYPEGSIIVKEKRRGRDASLLTGVGGMIKRAPGFDPDHGDWEYFYYENPATIQSGKIASCVECHARAKSTDYVFGFWASPKQRRE